MIYRLATLIGIMLLLAVGNAGAATVYVTSQLQFGLHADKTTSSPVVKVLPTGTPLELVKTEENLSYVRTVDGVDGWIDNSYVTQENPAVIPAQITIAAQSPDEASLVEQDLKSERIKTGELQVQIAELRKRLGQDGSNDSLYEKIDRLAVEKKQLEVQLAQLLEGTGQPQSESLPDNTGPESFYNLRNMLIILSVALIAGVIAGLYLMDFLYRRRHGGFRV